MGLRYPEEESLEGEHFFALTLFQVGFLATEGKHKEQ